jgi:hypothetical protein
MNSEARLRLLDGHLSAIAVENQTGWIESMADATMMVGLAVAANAMLMSWAPLEAPEFVTDLYRNEIGSVISLWDREVAGRFPFSRARELVSLHIVPYAVNTCLAHGLWFATLRHTPESVEPLALQFSISIARGHESGNEWLLESFKGYSTVLHMLTILRRYEKPAAAHRYVDNLACIGRIGSRQPSSDKHRRCDSLALYLASIPRFVSRERGNSVFTGT